MRCHEAEQYYTPFLENKLTGEKLARFLTHVQKCEACYEELEISYLLSAALARLENGETIDLKRELSSKITMARRAMGFHFLLDTIRRSVEITAFIAVSFSAVFFLLRFY